MVMMMATKKGDRSLGKWVLTRCVWGDILNPRCYCCCCRYHFFIFSFRYCLRQRFWLFVVRGDARASVICGSGDEEWPGAVMWRVAGVESFLVNSGCFMFVRTIQRPLPDNVAVASSDGDCY